MCAAKLPESTFTAYSLPFDASWTPDLWGRVRNTVRANVANAQASAADLENTRLTAQAELAVDYFQLRGQDALKQLLDSTVVAYEQSLELTKALYETGIDSDEAVAQAETQLEAARAQDTQSGHSARAIRACDRALGWPAGFLVLDRRRAFENSSARHSVWCSLATFGASPGHCRNRAPDGPGQCANRCRQGGIFIQR